jgi:uncharacterized protein (TIGR03086 family)
LATPATLGGNLRAVETIDLARCLAGFLDVVGRVGDVTRPSRCEGWSIAEVIAHVVTVTDRFTAFAADEPVSPSPDLRTAIARSGAAWAAVDLSRTCTLSFGTFDAPTAAGINAFDALVHGWDVAAAGVAYGPPDDLVLAATTVAEALVWDERQYRRPPASAPTGTPLQRLLVLTGRHPEA